MSKEKIGRKYDREKWGWKNEDDIQINFKHPALPYCLGISNKSGPQNGYWLTFSSYLFFFLITVLFDNHFRTWLAIVLCPLANQ